MIRNSRHIATEQRSFDEILSDLDRDKDWTEAVLSRLARLGRLPLHAKILDVGADAGGFIAACHDLGYQAVGIEPWQEARENACKLAEQMKVPIEVLSGRAESIPFGAGAFDVVHASGVIEHVLDVEQAFAEIYRVLKPGGVFWFNTASSMCPVQSEIRGFPLFGWYPDPWKRRIMNWVEDAKPHLVGFTRTPAIHWFTPSKARRLLGNTGFKHVYDRWDLRAEGEGQGVYRLALRLIRSTTVTKTCADILVPGCSYAAVK
jgi:SAM-dependent methyltransferase